MGEIEERRKKKRKKTSSSLKSSEISLIERIEIMITIYKIHNMAAKKKNEF